MQTQTQNSEQNAQTISAELIQKIHLIGAFIPRQKTITQEQMHKIHAIGGYVPSGVIVV